MASWIPGEALADGCCAALQLGINLLIQTTLLLAAGLLAGRWASRCGPVLQSLIYRTTLAAAVASAAVSLGAAGFVQPLWSVSLPSAEGAAMLWTARLERKTSTAVPPTPVPGSAARAVGALPGTLRTELPRAVPATRGAASTADGTAASLPDPFAAHFARSGRDAVRVSSVGAIGTLYVAAVALWALGSLALLLRLLLCHASLARLRRRSAPVMTGDAPAVLHELCTALGVAVPELRVDPHGRALFLAGLRRPAIFLPADYDTAFSSQELRAVLAHELIHLTRGDCAWRLLGRLACAAAWVQPLLWVLVRKLEEAGEGVCDETVAARYCPPRLYARCLLQFARHLVPSTAERVAGVGIVPFRSTLGQRIQQILDGSARRALVVSPRLRAAILLGAAATMAVCLTAVAAPEPAAPRGDREAARALFRGDTRLEVGVTMAHQDRPVGEVLAALGEEIEVPLVARGDAADDKVTLFCDVRPAAEALALLAGHLGYRWHRDGDGYELVQSVASRAREQAERERRLREQLADIHAQMEREAQKLTIPRAPLLARLDAANAREKEAVRLGRSGPEIERAVAERVALMSLLEPSRAPAVAIYRSLNPRQIEQLLAGRELYLSFADGTLSPTISRLVAAIPGLVVVGTPLAERLREKLWRRPEDAAARVSLIDLRVDPLHNDDGVGPPDPERSHLRLEIALPLGIGSGSVQWSSWRPWGIDARRPDAKRRALVTRTDDPALTRVVSLTFPRPDGERGAANSDAFVEAYGTVFGNWPAGTRTLGEVAAALHRETGLELVADSFIRARLPAGEVTTPQSVVALLDSIANRLDYTWHKEGSLIFLRSRRRYLDRPEEIPELIARPWRAQVRKQGAATLNVLAALAEALTEPQARGAQQYWGWYFDGLPTLPPNRGAGGFYGSWRHLRFWSALSPRQQQLALTGEILPVAQMTPAQRHAFAAVLASRDLRPYWAYEPEEGSREPTAEDVAFGAFRFEAGSLLPEGESPLKTISYSFLYHRPGERAPFRSAEMQIIAPQPAGR